MTSKEMKSSTKDPNSVSRKQTDKQTITMSACSLTPLADEDLTFNCFMDTPTHSAACSANQNASNDSSECRKCWRHSLPERAFSLMDNNPKSSHSVLDMHKRNPTNDKRTFCKAFHPLLSNKMINASRSESRELRASLLSSNRDSASLTSVFCRICHEGTGSQELMRACKCDGSIQHVHHGCLLNWVLISGDLSCELCGYEYKTCKTQPEKIRIDRVSLTFPLYISLCLSMYLPDPPFLGHCLLDQA